MTLMASCEAARATTAIERVVAARIFKVAARQDGRAVGLVQLVAGDELDRRKRGIIS